MFRAAYDVLGMGSTDSAARCIGPSDQRIAQPVKTHLRSFEQVQVELRGKIEAFPGSELQSGHETARRVDKVESMHDAIGGVDDVGQWQGPC